MRRVRLMIFAFAFQAIGCFSAASLCSVISYAQSDCEAAAELRYVCDKLTASPPAYELEDLLQRAIHVTDQCPSNGDAWYLRALIEQKLGKSNNYSMQKAQRLNSPSLKNGVSPCGTLSGTTAGGAPAPIATGSDKTPPRIEITSPRLDRGQKVTPVKSCTTAIEGQATDAESRVREVTVNGAPVELDGQGKFKVELKFPTGENRLYITATDTQNNTAREDFKIACDTPASRPVVASESVPAASGRYFAVLIGNNEYTHLPKLKTAIHDAEEIEKVLKNRFGFQTKLLINATRSQVINALTAYRKSLQPEDRLLIYYAGHGEYDDEAKRAYWIPTDGTKESPDNWISADDITGGVRVIPARHVLVISDSCYSGTMYRDAAVDLGRPRERDRFLEKENAGKSRMWMASGGKEPVADGGGSGHSIFARAVLDGLLGMRDVKFTAGELFLEYVKQRVAGKGDQMPEYNPLLKSDHESGDFVFMRAK